MNFFRFKILEPSGRVNSGVIRLPYKEVMSAISFLERGGGTAIYVKKLGRAGSLFMSLISMRFRRKVPRTFLAEFLRIVAMMLRGGMVLTTALEEAGRSSEMPDFEEDITDIINQIQSGSSLSEAATKYPHIFPNTVLHLVRIGEETGRLDAMLQDASNHLDRINAIIRDTKQALLYPAFVFVALGAGLIFWFYYVVPKILTLFQEMDVELPWLTLTLLDISDFVQARIIHLILGVICVIVLWTMLRRKNRGFRKATDMLLLALPLSGTIVSASNLAFISEYFYILLNAGLDLMQCIQILQDSTGNEIYKEKLGQVRESLANGNGVAESFEGVLIFPGFVVRMIHSGELSGTLPEQLAYVAENYRTRLAAIVATIGKTIEPVVLVVAGVIFAIIIGGLLLPIYDLVSQISGA